MPWPKTGATHYHAQLVLLRQRLYNQRVGCLIGVGYLRQLCTLHCNSKCLKVLWRGNVPEVTPYHPSNIHTNLNPATPLSSYQSCLESGGLQCAVYFHKLTAGNWWMTAGLGGSVSNQYCHDKPEKYLHIMNYVH